MGDLTREEFLTHIEYVRGDLAVMNAHLAALNGRTRTNENDIAVLKDRGVRKSDPTARWTAAIVGLAGVLAEIVRRVWGGSQ